MALVKLINGILKINIKALNTIYHNATITSERCNQLNACPLMSDETQVFIDAIDTNKEKKLISIGSSLKMCLVAEGESDIYPSSSQL